MSPLHLITHKKTSFQSGLEEQQAFSQIVQETHKNPREEIKEDVLQILAVQIISSGTKCRHPLAGERRYTP